LRCTASRSIPAKLKHRGDDALVVFEECGEQMLDVDGLMVALRAAFCARRALPGAFQ